MPSLHKGCPLSAGLRLTGGLFLDTTNPNKYKESSGNKQKLGQRLSNKIHLPHRATPWRQGETAALYDTH